MTSERRTEPRFPPPADAHISATLRPGCTVSIVNVSTRGVLVQGPRPLRPGARIQLQVVARAHRMLIPAQVTRCTVATLDVELGILYRGALEFEERVTWPWE